MLHTTLTERVQQNEASLGVPIALSANCPDKDKRRPLRMFHIDYQTMFSQ